MPLIALGLYTTTSQRKVEVAGLVSRLVAALEAGAAGKARRREDLRERAERLEQSGAVCLAHVQPGAVAWLWPGWIPAGKLAIPASARRACS